MSTLLTKLSDPAVWERFYQYRCSLISQSGFPKELRAFIDREGWKTVTDRIAAGEPFPLPKKSVISKMSTGKQRTVYTYPPDENTVLKLLTYLMLRQYDSLFSPNLYSFRPHKNAKDAILFFTHIRGLREMYAYKADISDYFNSVPAERLLGELEAVMQDDPQLFAFLRSLLTEPNVLDGGTVHAERKGIMAGTPVACIYANLYLRALDAKFFARGVPYARYSDDVILFAETEQQCRQYAAELREYLRERGLTLNPRKEHFYRPYEAWVFLGFCVKDGQIDIAPASVTKLCRKMRRKARGLRRWADRRGVPGEKAAAAFIRIFNAKLLESPGENRDLTWSCWFFPVITTAESLRKVDRYAQDCIRYIISGKRTKARYNVRYADMKQLGYRSLVHEYYADPERGEPPLAFPSGSISRRRPMKDH